LDKKHPIPEGSVFTGSQSTFNVLQPPAKRLPGSGYIAPMIGAESALAIALGYFLR
jgi:hypothetical protein